MHKHLNGKKLRIQKETLNKLNAGELGKVAGGASGQYSCRCPPGSIEACVTDHCTFTQTNC